MTTVALDWFGPWPVTIDALATLRLTRLATRDHLPPVLAARRWLDARTYPSPWGVLWTCHWCLGFWIAVLIVGGHTTVAALGGDIGHRWWLLAMLPWAIAAAAGLAADLADRREAS